MVCIGRFSPRAARGKSTPPGKNVHGREFPTRTTTLEKWIIARRGLFSEYHLLINCVICMAHRVLTASHCVDRMCTLAKMLMMVEKTNTTAQPFMWDINYSTRQTNKKNSESAECKLKAMTL